MKKQDLIEQDIIRMITQCILGPGDKLPSIRKLARQYNVSISPVKSAYNALISRHWVEARPSSGYYVTEYVLEDPEVKERSKYLGGNSSERYELLDTFQNGFGRTFNMKNNIRLGLGSTPASPSYYPHEELAQHLARSSRSLPSPVDNLQAMPHDALDFKKEVFKWARSSGLDFNIDSLSILRGVSDGIQLALRTCAEPGSVVAVESPGFAGFYFSTALFGYKVMPVMSDPITGLDVDRFEHLLRSGQVPSCLLLCSTFSNPTGAVMPDDSKRRLTSLCADYAVPIIEDDIMGDLYYGSSRPMPLKIFDRENVIYVSGFGKCLAPVFRTGYVDAGKYAERFAFYKHLMLAYTPHSVQAGMASFLHSGSAQEYVRLLRRRLALLKDSYRELIFRYFPDGTEVSDPQGGLYLWVKLPGKIDSNRFSNLAENYGISVSPASLFNAPLCMGSSFRLNIAAIPWNKEARAAVKTLGQLASSLAGQEPNSK